MKQLTIDFDLYRKELADKVAEGQESALYQIGSLLLGNDWWAVKRDSRLEVVLAKIRELTKRDQHDAKD